MSRKAEKREQRRALGIAKFEESKASFIAKVALSDQPKVATPPPTDAMPRVAPHLAREQQAQEQQPKAIKDGSRFGLSVTWCVTRADLEGHWTWGEARGWEQKEWDEEIKPAFSSFAMMTWGDVDKCSSESGHRMHHHHELGDLVAEAQNRWVDLGLEQFDTVFRFRLGGKKRAWGFIAQAHFHFIWWDRQHAIYPV